MSLADASSIDAAEASLSGEARTGAIARPAVVAGRLTGLDWLRFAATLLMVQGHVFYVVLHESVTAERWFRWHRYVHGLTAPMFLFGAGFAFAFVTLRAAASGKPRSAAKRLERALLLLLVGYALQVPRLSLDAVLALDAAGLARALRVNTLQCIAVSLAVCELALAVGRTRRGFGTLMGFFAAGAVFLAPAAWRLDTEGWPVFFSSFVHGHHGSIFPIFPWSGFLFAGAALAAWRTDPARGTVRPGTIAVLFATGAFAWLAGRLLTDYGVDPFGEHAYWKTSPWFFLVRTGLVVTIFAALLGLATLARRPADAPRGRSQPGVIERVAAETLVVYVVHLVLLYGTSWQRGLRAVFGPTLGLGQASLVALAVVVASLLFALGWHELKRRAPRGVSWGVRGALVLSLGRFLLG